MTKRILSFGALAITCLLGASCGSSSSDSSSNTKFTGTWQYTSGTSTANCGGQSETEQLTGTISLSEGITSDLVMVDDPCTFKLDVTGTTASIGTPQACNQVSEGNNVTLNVNSLTITLTGLVADYSASGTLLIATPTANVSCTYTLTGKLQKISK